MRHRAALILASLVLFAAGFLNYRPWRGYNADRHVEFGTEPIRIANSVVHEGNFANPFGALRTGPTAHIAPGFPFLQFLILKIFGDGANGWLAIQILPILALGLELAMLPWAARWIGLPAWSGVLAAIFGLVTKPGGEPQWEAHWAGFLGLVLLANACRFEMNRRSAPLALATGASAGIVFYFQPVFALPYFCWIVLLTRECRNRYILPLFLVPFVLCIPWSARNYLEIGTPEMRDDLGLELYVSFNDCAPYGFEENLKRLCQGAFHPNSSVQEAQEIRSLGEYRYNRERLHTAMVWISAHPYAAGALMLQRFWFFWFPSAEGLTGYRRQNARRLFLHACTLISLWGLYLCWKQRLRCFRPLCLCLVLFPMVYYVVEFDPRYRYPILWITWLLAAYAIVTFLSRAISFRAAGTEASATAALRIT